jgi:hypothetical protein
MDAIGAQFTVTGRKRNHRSCFPVDTINLFQALDLVFFGAIENNKDSLTNEPEVASVRGQIWKFVGASKQTATSSTIRSHFCKVELSSNTQTRPFKLEFNEEALRQNDGFHELRYRNISIAELSRGRPMQRFRIPNTELLDA